MKFVGEIDFTVGPDILEGRKVNFVDTFYLSMFLNPDREKHSIEYFGNVLGYPKLDFRQASIDEGIISKDADEGAEFQQHSTLMDKYCEIDTEISDKTFKYLLQEWQDLYGSFDGWTPAFKAGQKSFFLMSCQELSGWKFDVEAAKNLQYGLQKCKKKSVLLLSLNFLLVVSRKPKKRTTKCPQNHSRLMGIFCTVVEVC